MKNKRLCYAVLLVLFAPLFMGMRGRPNCEVCEAARDGDLKAFKKLYHNYPGVIAHRSRKGTCENFISENSTPLHHAARGGHLELVQFLIEKGADPNLIDNYGYRPIDLAMENKKTKTAKYLKMHGPGIKREQTLYFLKLGNWNYLWGMVLFEPLIGLAFFSFFLFVVMYLTFKLRNRKKNLN